MRLYLTRAEAEVLIAQWNRLADRGIRVQHRFEDGQRHIVVVRDFIKKLLRAGLRDGTFVLPACFGGPADIRQAAKRR